MQSSIDQAADQAPQDRVGLNASNCDAYRHVVHFRLPTRRADEQLSLRGREELPTMSGHRAGHDAMARVSPGRYSGPAHGRDVDLRPGQRRIRRSRVAGSP